MLELVQGQPEVHCKPVWQLKGVGTIHREQKTRQQLAMILRHGGSTGFVSFCQLCNYCFRRSYTVYDEEGRGGQERDE